MIPLQRIVHIPEIFPFLCRNLEPYEHTDAEFELTPKRPGRRFIEVSFSAKEVSNSASEIEIEVEEWVIKQEGIIKQEWIVKQTRMKQWNKSQASNNWKMKFKKEITLWIVSSKKYINQQIKGKLAAHMIQQTTFFCYLHFHVLSREGRYRMCIWIYWGKTKNGNAFDEINLFYWMYCSVPWKLLLWFIILNHICIACSLAVITLTTEVPAISVPYRRFIFFFFFLDLFILRRWLELECYVKAFQRF